MASSPDRLPEHLSRRDAARNALPTWPPRETSVLQGNYLHVEKGASSTIAGIAITELSEWEVTVDADGLATKKRAGTYFVLTGDSGRFGGDPFHYWDDADEAAQLLAKDHEGDIEWYRKYFTGN